MRAIEALSLAVGLLLTFAPPLGAQNWEDSGYLNINFGSQTQDQTFTESATFDVYGEQGAVAAGHAIGGGRIFDINAGARVWKNLGVGIGYSSFKSTNDPIVSVRVPHPFQFNRPREASATVPDLEHTENVVHLQLVWMLPLTDRIQLAFTGGPSFFTVRHDMATVRPTDITDVAPFTMVALNSVTVTDVKESPVGVNIGIDASYLVSRMIGVGAFARYAGASVEFPIVAGSTIDGDVKLGGFQAGGGLRFRF